MFQSKNPLRFFFLIPWHIGGEDYIAFEAISRKFQFKFKDRVTAANIQGEALKDTIKKDQIPNVIVLGIPRGGVITADIVARKLSSAEFDIVIPRKLTDPDNKEQAIGAIMEDGTTYLDEQLIRDFQISSEYLEKGKSYQIEEIKRRTSLFLGDDITRSSNSDLLTNSLPVCFRLRDRELITEF